VTEAVRSRRAYVWLSCAAKSCCEREVVVTAADIVRIARGLAVDPWHFVASAPATEDDPGGLVLDQSGDRRRPVLMKSVVGCVFLIRTSSGAGRCGLGDLAPVSCRIFPADPAAAKVTVRADPGCVCRDWTDDDLEAVELTGPLSMARLEGGRSDELIAKWNTYAATRGEAEPKPDLEDFLRYVLTAQTILDSGGDWAQP
jgi:hypothetical protein